MKEIALEAKLMESVNDVLDMVKPEHVLLNAIMELQTADVSELRLDSAGTVVDDLNLLRTRLGEFATQLGEYAANGGDVDSHEVFAIVQQLTEGLAAAEVLNSAVVLFNASSVEQLCAQQARSTVADLANVCGAFVRLREAYNAYFDVKGFDADID